ncbi:MAG: prevent-host-death family protein [Caballeronia sp.]|jgi:prevent-host-death family protein|uniref:type II toxin-antitoxin system Phd/YefM family antitoxin n=1 Tax=Caballeronia sp. TaxID=1931223 RepID=UPI002633836E|nr:type II toxin-antitoxin system prevent-host-death family antitoxin [Caballeronia sp.]MDB5835105.1 prevent-host-death family protein [Caballeronia sp.]
MPTITVNMHEAKTNLSRLVEKAVQGESVVIAKAGKPMVRIVAIDAQAPAKKKRIGFLAGQVTVPDAQTFNDLGRDEIAAMFGGDE